MKNRFDLEQEIMDVWHVVDNLETVVNAMDNLEKDEIKAMLSGLAKLNHLKFEILFETFEDCIRSEIQGPWHNDIDGDPVDNSTAWACFDNGYNGDVSLSSSADDTLTVSVSDAALEEAWNELEGDKEDA